MEYEKKELLIYQQGKTITDQFYIDDDYNVPDAKNDVRRVVLSEGTLQVEDVKVVENYIRVSGKMNFRVLYAADDSENRLACLDGRLPFEEMVYMEEPLTGNPFIKSSDIDITVTMIHSRKLNVKALAELQVCSEGQEQVELTIDAENGQELYKKTSSHNLLRLFTIKKDTYRIKEELSLGGTKENIGNLLWTEVTGRKLDTKIGRAHV